MSLLQACQWLNDTQLGTAIRESDVVFPLIETVHVLGIALLAGTVAIVDLRLLGKGNPFSSGRFAGVMGDL
jgi:hypothetical protein